MAKSFLNQSGLPIGLRNNNPGNIRPGDNWKGMIGTNGGFVTFENIAWGIRAMFTDLAGDVVDDGLTTITKLITEYAPPNENPTGNYIQAVSEASGIGPNETIPRTEDGIIRLMKGMVAFELGSKYAGYITTADIKEGIALANDKWKDAFSYKGTGTQNNLLIGLGLAGLAAAMYQFVYKN